MKRRKKESTMEDTFCWRRQSSGHYVLWGEYVTEEKEIMAEVRKQKNKWKYCLWTWGSQNPEPLEYSRETFGTAREVKRAAMNLVTRGEPPVNQMR